MKRYRTLTVCITVCRFTNFNSVTKKIGSDEPTGDERDRDDQSCNKLPIIRFEWITWFQIARNYPVCIAVGHVT